MTRLPVVAVVGRPNVGKSTLVNRILRRRAAVVQEKPGVTRDRKEFDAEWAGRHFVVVDTGGWELSPDGELTMGIREQSEVALAGADAVVFVTDARTPLTDDDEGIAKAVLRAGVPHLIVANKVDGPDSKVQWDHLWSLGLGEPLEVSALNGYRTGDLLDRVVAMLPDGGDVPTPGDALPTLAILGRPNVGKSTLLNKLVGSDRVLVSPEPGTTRDAIDAVIELDGQPFRIYDTAGIRRAPKVKDDTEFYSVVRARRALDEADVALLMVDGHDGATHQEQRLAEEIASSGTGLVVLLNKWDAITTEEREWTEDSVADRLAFVSWAPVLRLSARTGARLHRLGPAARMVLENRRRRIPTPELNRQIRAWQQAHPAPTRKGRRGRIIYATQVGTSPPTILLFVRGGLIGPDYLRFLEGRLRSEHDFVGTPIKLVTRRRAPREASHV